MLKLTHTRAVFLMVVVTLLWSIAGLVTRHLVWCLRSNLNYLWVSQSKEFP